ncbi:MAG: 4Fe-4S ferredoxin [Deltaproteobacteria bacterium]|nr:MAG: 4Fe-4S ferredoxin [Deltaproteobacteria bacterium]
MKQVHINYERCIGCKHCEIACIIEHSSSKDILNCINEWPIPKRFINVEVNEEGLTFPVNCRHCEFPLCMNVCPMSAIKKDEMGFVQIDPLFCIGCGMCGLACPFGVVSYNVIETPLKKRIAVKCNGCKERISSERAPACVEACKTGALFYGSMDEYEGQKRKELAFTISEETVPRIPEEVAMWRDYLKKVNNFREG